jgi:hypothetical protein
MGSLQEIPKKRKSRDNPLQQSARPPGSGQGYPAIPWIGYFLDHEGVARPVRTVWLDAASSAPERKTHAC